jgi:iron complex transport system ATP-binding protein
LDEPTAHLDPRNQHRVLEVVSQLAEQHVSFVISSHNPSSALLYAHHVVVMKAGGIVAQGKPSDVLTEEVLSASYEMPLEVVYTPERVARAVIPRRSNGINSVPV